MTDTPVIRKATPSDLDAIEVWLKEEWERSKTGFYVNWEVIQHSISRDELFVLAVGDDIPGFLSTSCHQPNIAEVRKDARGHGYGRLIAEFAERNAQLNGLSIVRLHCSPEESISFWAHMGYEIKLELGIRPRYIGTKSLT